MVSFVGVVLHGAEFYVADGNTASAHPPASVVRTEPVGVVPATLVSWVLADDDRSLGRTLGATAARAGLGLTLVVAALVGTAVRRFAARPDRLRSLRGRPAEWAGRAPPPLRMA